MKKYIERKKKAVLPRRQALREGLMEAWVQNRIEERKAATPYIVINKKEIKKHETVLP